MVTTVPLGARRGRRVVVRRWGPRWLVAITLSNPSKVSSRPRTPEPRPVAALLMITSTCNKILHTLYKNVLVFCTLS